MPVSAEELDDDDLFELTGMSNMEGICVSDDSDSDKEEGTTRPPREAPFAPSARVRTPLSIAAGSSAAAAARSQSRAAAAEAAAALAPPLEYSDFLATQVCGI